MNKWLFPLLALSLAGCAATVPERAPVARAGGDACGASEHTDLVGQDGTVLERMLLLRQVRVIRPGTAVPLDLREARLNFQIGADGRIISVFCG